MQVIRFLNSAGSKDSMTSLGLLIGRIVSGGAMLTHGFPKLQKLVNGNFQFGDPIGIGAEASLFLTVFAEFFLALLLIIGFKTRWVAIPLAFTMFVAYFIVHGQHAFGDKELSFIYLGFYLSFIFTGAGRFSVDGLR